MEQSEKVGLDLNFTPRTVREIEQFMKMPIGNVVTSTEMLNILILVRKGLDLKDDKQAEDALSDYFDRGGDVKQLLLLVIERLQEQGFLDKEENTMEKVTTELEFLKAEADLALLKRKEEIKKIKQEIKTLSSSTNDGEDMNEMQ